ncbi:hypothetical protein [Leptolyngbya sp. FACHB-671]|uniref:hypothetical protein n=1 Tax=Leptolyngbya sp. FACHB-671 TaxID=2692812 RepID=UPI0018EF5A01|nr:hypothetical protein [Leptolyngbya sp. FACHB-671]
MQIKATSRILGAAAKIAQNHDQLIDEVVEMVEEDLDKQTHTESSKPYTVEQLQKQFKTIKDAKAHFNIRANSWAALVSKLNEQSANSNSQTSKPQTNKRSANSGSQASKLQDSTIQRIESIEHEIQVIRRDVKQVINLLNLIVEKLP